MTLEYHFKIRNAMAAPGSRLQQDADGFETVRQQALELARNIARAQGHRGPVAVDVTNAAGEVVLSLEVTSERGVTMTYPPLEAGALSLE